MKTLHKILILTILTTTTLGTLHAQDYASDQTSYQEGGIAYDESSHAYQWTAYIPLTVLVGAAIFLGFADKNHEHSSSHAHSSSSDPYDAIGSLYSKRGGYSH